MLWGFANELLMNRSSQQISKGVSGLGLHPLADVAVHCHRERGVSMAEPLLDDLGEGTRADQTGGMDVSKVMESEARVSRFPRQFLKVPGQRGRVERLSKWAREHQVQLVPAFAELHLVQQQLAPVFPQQGNGTGIQSDAPPT